MKESALCAFELVDPQQQCHALGEMPAVIAEQYLDRVALRVAREVDVGSDVALLEPCIEDPEVVPDHLGSQLHLVVAVREPVGDSLELGSPEGADVADLIEDLAAGFKVLVDQGMQVGVERTYFYFEESSYILKKVIEEAVMAICFRLEEGGFVDELSVEGELIYEGMHHTVYFVLELSGVEGT